MKKPNQTQIAPQEVAICERLADWSKGTSIPRAAIARAARIPVATLQMYEAARAPLTWGVTRKLMRTFGLSPAFLVEGGELPQTRDFGALHFSIPAIDPAQRLSVVWNSILRPSLRESEASARPGNLEALRRFLAAADMEGSELSDEVVSDVAAAARRTFPEPATIRLRDVADTSEPQPQ